MIEGYEVLVVARVEFKIPGNGDFRTHFKSHLVLFFSGVGVLKGIEKKNRFCVWF